MKYGYCRISTAKQSIERQIRNIAGKYPDAKIITEVFTGTTTARPAWEKLTKKLKKGDVLIFDSVSRMSRNAEEGFETYKQLFDLGVELHFLKEPMIDTETYKKALEGQLQINVSTGDSKTDDFINDLTAAMNKYLLRLAQEQIKIAFDQAQKEVDDLHQRTREGMETARLNGKQIGGQTGVKLTTKKSLACKELIRKHSKSFGGTLDDVELIKLCGCSRNSFYKYKAELKAGETA